MVSFDGVNFERAPASNEFDLGKSSVFKCVRVVETSAAFGRMERAQNARGLTGGVSSTLSIVKTQIEHEGKYSRDL